MESNEWMAGRLSEEANPPVPGIDTSEPSIARVYDYFLGGKDNFAADRAVAGQIVEYAPRSGVVAVSNRAALRRAVRHLVRDVGIGQFLDIGSGLPTAGNVHEVAHELDPRIPVVYVDNDPIVLVHGRALLADNRTTTVIQADIRDPEGIVDHADARRLIDFDRPVGVLLAGILHHLNDDDDPNGVMRRLRDGMAGGSHVFVTHFFDPGNDPVAKDFERIMQEGFGGGRYRTRPEIESFFDGFETCEPGVVRLIDWRPDPDDPEEDHELQRYMVAGLGRRG